MLSRRSFLIASGALAGASLGAARARAQGFPAGLVRIIVPFPPGGGTDVLGRLLGSGLQTLWGQSVILDNRPGAAGLIGTRQVAAAPADGHTLLMASTGAILTLAASHAGTEPYDVGRDLAAISLVAAPPYIVVANPSLPVHGAADVIAYAKQNPGRLTYPDFADSTRLPGLFTAQVIDLQSASGAKTL